MNKPIRLQLVVLSSVVIKIFADESSEGEKMKEPMSSQPVSLRSDFIVQRVFVRHTV